MTDRAAPPATLATRDFLLDVQHLLLHIKENLDASNGPDFGGITTMLKRIGTMLANPAASSSTTRSGLPLDEFEKHLRGEPSALASENATGWNDEQATLLLAALHVMEEWDGGLDEQDGTEHENACKDWADCLAALREWKRLHDARPSALSARNATRSEIIEECALACYGEQVDAKATGEESDRLYNRACKDCAEAIRALDRRTDK